ncbi:GHMP kinase [Methylobacillus arboreus]|uniref:beta-ribofuranosylaminobenzene 5'-phosphate synthase family protein n=1 Tax=Methylobacillus arboreus TaxID=755170 RepID=UPI002E1B2E55|nr:GHMP kinase [Methylobacillus arboreus]
MPVFRKLKEIIINKQGVSVVTTARLHMGFFDLNGDLGRRFGSIGVSLNQPATELYAWHASTFTAEGPGAARAVRMARKLAESLRLEGGMHIRLVNTIPEHSGLGSGTQMALAVGLALNRLHDLGLIIRDVAMLTERGARSGIGLGTFASGGVIIDGGRGAQTVVPPVIARAEFPEDWRIILIFDHTQTGVHGEAEIAAFRNLPQFPADAAAILCRHVLMQALPALAEHDLPAFGAAIRELQVRTGDHFAPAQGGRYASPRVAEVLAWLEAEGVACFGQSSWGPTGFAILPDENEAERVMARLQALFSRHGALEFLLCEGRNEGGVVSDLPETVAVV